MISRHVVWLIFEHAFPLFVSDCNLGGAAVYRLHPGIPRRR